MIICDKALSIFMVSGIVIIPVTLYLFFVFKVSYVRVYKQSVILGTCHHYYNKMHLPPECVCTEHCILQDSTAVFSYCIHLPQQKQNRTDDTLHVKYCKMKKLLQRDSTVCICTVFIFCCLNSVLKNSCRLLTE